MSQFQEIHESSLIKQAAPLKTNGATCDCYAIELRGKRQFLKRLKPEFADDPRYIALFTKEFTIGSKLSHPNLVRYNEMETSKDGVLMLMDFVSGETVDEKLKSDPSFFQNSNNLIRLLTQLLDCLSYLHSNQIVHLDIKADNLMLSQVDNSLVILDLGFCYTDSYNSLIGKTEGYAAPEQVSGTTDQIDERTDLFAVGQLIKQIEEKAFIASGSTLPHKVSNLMSCCLKENKEDRPRSAKQCIGMLSPSKKRLPWYIGVIAILLISCFAVGNKSVRTSAAYIINNFRVRDYDVRDMDNTLYRILSKEDMTCEVVGYRHDPNDRPDVYIKNEVEYFGKTYKTVSIRESAFDSLGIITSVFIPDGIERIGSQAFKWDSLIVSIFVPNSVKTIGHSCFSDITYLQHIKLPDGLKELEFNMFTCDENLESIILPKGIERIGKDCFVSCMALTEIRMPSALKVIERGAFYNCTSLTNIEIPASCEEIGEYAFFECSSLTDVYNYAETPQDVSTIFNTRGVRIHVPSQSVDAYRSHPAWRHLEILPM